MKKTIIILIFLFLIFLGFYQVKLNLIGKSIETPCEETDSGIDYYTKGTVFYKSQGVSKNATDWCNNYRVMYEYTCSNENELQTVKVSCEAGCIDGACQRNITEANQTQPQIQNKTQEEKQDQEQKEKFNIWSWLKSIF